jgi:hypothetical protein
MKKSKRAMRRAVLCKLFEHLEKYYGFEWSRETFVDGQLSLPQIDAILAFKSDPQLDEFRGALVRLENGTFGLCISCRGSISQDVLEVDPVRRFCQDCEKDLGHVMGNDAASDVEYMS